MTRAWIRGVRCGWEPCATTSILMGLRAKQVGRMACCSDVIWQYDYDASSGTIENERPFLAGFERGAPDGSAMDSEGYLWNCRFFGGCIVRVALDGKIDRVVEMPVQNITTCTFGGADRKTLYVTTAKAEAPAGDRLAGGLYAIQTEVVGQAENSFRAFGR